MADVFVIYLNKDCKNRKLNKEQMILVWIKLNYWTCKYDKDYCKYVSSLCWKKAKYLYEKSHFQNNKKVISARLIILLEKLMLSIYQYYFKQTNAYSPYLSKCYVVVWSV